MLNLKVDNSSLETVTKVFEFGDKSTSFGNFDNKPSVPQKLQVKPDLSSKSITLTWDASTDEGSISDYEVKLNSGASWISTSNALTHTFTGLTIGTTYDLQVRAKDNANTYSNIAIRNLKLGNLAPTVPSNLATTLNTTAQTIALSWTASSDSDGNIRKYEVSLDGTNWIDSGSDLTHTFTGLTIGTTYTLQVRAKDNEGAYSSVASTSLNLSLWPNLSSSWKKAIAQNVASISGTETSLSASQESDFFNLIHFSYHGSGPTTDKLKTLAPVKYMTKLTWLDLSSNQLTSIPSGAFTDLSSLTMLDLGSNQLTSFSNGAFNHMNSLYKLYLSGQTGHTWTTQQRTDIRAQVKSVPTGRSSSQIYFDNNSTHVQGTR